MLFAKLKKPVQLVVKETIVFPQEKKPQSKKGTR
jgi:hypothetical protein